MKFFRFLFIGAVVLATHARGASLDFAQTYEFLYGALEKSGARLLENRGGVLALGEDGGSCRVRLRATVPSGDIEEYGFKMEIGVGGRQYEVTFSPRTVKQAALRDNALTARLDDFALFDSQARQPDYRSSDPWLGVPEYRSKLSDVEILVDREGRFQSIKTKNAAGRVGCGY